MKEHELYWLAGLLEGEGSFCKGTPSQPNVPSINLHMKDYDVVHRVANIFGNTVVFLKSKVENHSDTYRTQLRGKPAVDLMIKLKPLMGIRRQQQIQRAINSFEIKPIGKLSKDDVTSIVELKGDKSAKEVASMFNVSHWRIYQIWRGESSYV